MSDLKNFNVNNGININGTQVIDGKANGTFNVLTANSLILPSGNLVNTVSSAFDAANTGINLAQESYNQGNSTATVANTALNNSASASLYANTGIDNAASASLYANTGITIGNEAFNRANAANVLAQAAFDKANTGVANGATIYTNAIITAANGTVGIPGQVLTTNGSSIYWSTVSGGGGGGGSSTQSTQYNRPGVLSISQGSNFWNATTDLTIINIIGKLGSAPTGTSNLVINLTKNNTTNLANLTFVPGSTYAEANSNFYSLLKNDQIRIDVAQTGSAWPGSDLTLSIVYQR